MGSIPVGTHAWVAGLVPGSGPVWQLLDVSVLFSLSPPLSKINKHVLGGGLKNKKFFKSIEFIHMWVNGKDYLFPLNFPSNYLLA